MFGKQLCTFLSFIWRYFLAFVVDWGWKYWCTLLKFWVSMNSCNWLCFAQTLITILGWFWLWDLDFYHGSFSSQFVGHVWTCQVWWMQIQDMFSIFYVSCSMYWIRSLTLNQVRLPCQWDFCRATIALSALEIIVSSVSPSWYIVNPKDEVLCPTLSNWES